MGHGTRPRRDQAPPGNSGPQHIRCNIGRISVNSHTHTDTSTHTGKGNFGLLYCVTQPGSYSKEKAEVQLMTSMWDAGRYRPNELYCFSGNSRHWLKPLEVRSATPVSCDPTSTLT